jgi:ribosomal protein S17
MVLAMDLTATDIRTKSIFTNAHTQQQEMKRKRYNTQPQAAAAAAEKRRDDEIGDNLRIRPLRKKSKAKDSGSFRELSKNQGKIGKFRELG